MTLEIFVKAAIVLSLISATLYIHFRGRVRYSFFRQLFDHSTFMAPINAMMYAFSSVPKTPYLPVTSIPTLNQIRDNWETIKSEALTLESSKLIKGSNKYNDIGFNSFFRRGWKRFYLKWYNSFKVWIIWNFVLNLWMPFGYIDAQPPTYRTRSSRSSSLLYTIVHKSVASYV